MHNGVLTGLNTSSGSPSVRLLATQCLGCCWTLRCQTSEVSFPPHCAAETPRLPNIPQLNSSAVAVPRLCRKHRHIVCAQASSSVYEGSMMAPGMSFAVIVGQFNSLVTDRLESGALAGLRKSGVDDGAVDIVHVPGSFEIPVVAKSMALTGKYDAVICIGAVVRGATTHYEEVCSAATSGCSHAAVASGTNAMRTA